MSTTSRTNAARYLKRIKQLEKEVLVLQGDKKRLDWLQAAHEHFAVRMDTKPISLRRVTDETMRKYPL
jgi:hypothetical protein